MASENSLNLKNLKALGAERLAELLLELATGDASAKRRLRLELASKSGGADVASEIRKRLIVIERARSYVDWRKIKALAHDLDVQRSAIVAHLSQSHPKEAFDLLWRLLEMAPSIYERCDDSNGTIGSILARTMDDLSEVVERAQIAPDRLAETVFKGVCDNGYGQFDDLIPQMAQALGKVGLGLLKAKFEALAAEPFEAPRPEDRRIVGYSSRGPIYADDYEAARRVRIVSSGLMDVADALGDADGYAACFSEEDHANPAIAAKIAKRYLASERPSEALVALERAETNFQNGGYWPDWPGVRIDVLDALSRNDEAQSARWDIFERSLSAEYLKAYLKRLPDFEDQLAEDRALSYVRKHPNLHEALAFLIAWPAHRLAAELVLERHDDLDGDRYELLTPGAEALENRYPLAATIMLRAMIEFSLARGKHTRYGHAARHLQTCEDLALRIDEFSPHMNHETYLASLKLRHGRKTGFWNL